MGFILNKLDFEKSRTTLGFILQESMAGREDDTACRVAQEKMIEQFGQFIEVYIE